MKKLIFIVFVLLFSSLAYAVDIENPRIVDIMTAEVVQTVSISMDESPNILELKMYIPQEDEHQKILSFSMDYNYTFVKDKFGNRMVYVKWKKPDKKILFSIKSLVEVNKRHLDENYKYEEFLKPNSLVNSDDIETRKIAESLIIGKNEFERIASMTTWVNERLEYDMKYFSVNLSSKETLKTGSGVCDEYSTLLSALARSVGYYSPYIVGYAYGKEKFQAHGWTSINGVLSDPTWAEMPIDATHIKFAVLEDAVYNEANISVMGFGKIKKPSIEVNVTVNPVTVHTTKTVKTNSEFLPSPGEYAVLKTELSSNGCVLTRLIVKSCIYEDSPFLEGGFERNIYFCNNKTVFSVLKAPDIQNKKIICPVTVFSRDGTNEIVDLSITDSKKNDIGISIGNTIFETGEVYSVYSPESYIFTEDGQYGFENAFFKAMENTTLYVYRNGSIDSKKIIVLNKKPMDVYMQLNNTVFLGDYVDINLTIENKLNKLLNISVKLGDKIENVLIPSLSNRTLNLRFLPENINDNILQINFYSKDFSTSMTEMLNVLEKEKNLLDTLIAFFADIEKMFENIFENITILINFN